MAKVFPLILFAIFPVALSDFSCKSVNTNICFIYIFPNLFLMYVKVIMKVLVAQSCPTLSNPIDCSLPDSSVHGIL